MTPDQVLECFADAAAAVRNAVAAIPTDRRRDRTGRPGQYALDLAADAAMYERRDRRRDGAA